MSEQEEKRQQIEPDSDGVVRIKTEVWLDNGNPLFIEAENKNPFTAIDAIHDAIAYGITEKGWRDSPVSRQVGTIVEAGQSKSLGNMSPDEIPSQTHTVINAPSGQMPPVPASTGGPNRPPQFVTADGHEVIKVSSISVKVTGNGLRYVLVKGVPYVKNGVRAWPEVLPLDFQNQLPSLPLGAEVPPGAEMAYAITSRLQTDNKWADKVIGFTTQIT